MAFEGRLVVFYREDVVCFFLLDQIAGGGLLSVECIRGDDPPFDGQRVQKRFEDGDFVGMLGNGLLSHDGGSLMEESRKDMGLAAIRERAPLRVFPSTAIAESEGPIASGQPMRPRSTASASTVWIKRRMVGSLGGK